MHVNLKLPAAFNLMLMYMLFLEKRDITITTSQILSSLLFFTSRR